MILELALAASLTFGPPDAGWTLALDARATIEAPWALTGAPRSPCGIAYGPVAFVRPCTWIDTPDGTVRGADPVREHVLRHEAGHLEQHSAIGPALYALDTLAPHAVEDYIEGATWHPRESEVGTCPLLRLEGSSPRHLDRLRVAPCYPSLFGIRLPAP